MTMVPYGPIWCWNVLGEDAQLFSQPTLAGHGSSLVSIGGAGSWVARCQYTSWMEEYDGTARTFLIQCGRVATIAPDGTYRCVYHAEVLWECRRCHAWLPDGKGGYCPACEQAARAEALSEGNL